MLQVVKDIATGIAEIVVDFVMANFGVVVMVSLLGFVPAAILAGHLV